MSFLHVLKSLKFPKRLDDWKLGIQISTLVLTTGWICCSSKLNITYFHGHARWIVSSATSILNTSLATTMHNAIFQILGLSMACLVVVSIVRLCLTGKQLDDHSWKPRLAIYILVSLSGLFYNAFAAYSETLLPLTRSAISYTPLILGGSLFSADSIKSIITRFICLFIGLIASLIVSRLIFPVRYTVDCVNNLSDILNNLSNTIEPLLLIQAGILEIDEDISHKVRLTKQGLEMKERKLLNYELWENNKARIWTNLQDAGKTINIQLQQLKFIIYEFPIRSSSKIDLKIYHEALKTIRIMYYQLCSTYFSIENYMSQQSKDSTFLLLNTKTTSNLYIKINKKKRSISSSSKKYNSISEIVINFVDNLVTSLNSCNVSLKLLQVSSINEKSLLQAVSYLAKFHSMREESQRLYVLLVNNNISNLYTSKNSIDSQHDIMQKLCSLTFKQYDQMKPNEKQYFWESFWLGLKRLAIADVHFMNLLASTKAVTYYIKQLIISKARTNDST